MLQRVKIDRFGVISLSQALELILLETDDLTVTESKVVEVADGEYLNVNSDIDFSNTGFKATLYPYQQTGVSWLESITNEGLGSVLADEMGLGKTVQIIALLSIFKKKWRLPSLIITRATIIENWRREFDKFSDGLSVRVHMGVKRSGLPSKIKKFDVTLTSYETAVRDQLMFALIEWGFVVLDEAQDIKNPWTNRAIAVKSFKRRISIAVTGTPVENKLLDLWSIMDFTHSGLLGAKNHFEENFVNNESSARQIERIVSPFMLRRLISEVADDLPEKIIIPQAIEMSEIEIELYEVLRQEIVAEYGAVAELVSMIKLRQFCTHPLILEECKELNHLLAS
ncbi:MAG TPA: hypothetical protein EYO73_11280, partial [Sulfurimonas sp.]|nr:hypothetical protein [Sulfurimonas sp.]